MNRKLPRNRAVGSKERDSAWMVDNSEVDTPAGVKFSTCGLPVTRGNRHGVKNGHVSGMRDLSFVDGYDANL